jgi:hypothetical protein
MAKTTDLENVILFARAGFRGTNDTTQVETIMNAVVDVIEGTDLMVDGESVGTISNAEVVGSLIRGNVTGVDTAFLQTEAGQNLCRRIAASVEAPAAPVKRTGKTVPKKPAKPSEIEEEEEAEPEEEPKAAPKKVIGKPTGKPAPSKPGVKKPTPVTGKGKIKVTL